MLVSRNIQIIRIRNSIIFEYSTIRYSKSSPTNPEQIVASYAALTNGPLLWDQTEGLDYNDIEILGCGWPRNW